MKDRVTICLARKMSGRQRRRRPGPSSATTMRSGTGLVTGELMVSLGPGDGRERAGSGGTSNYPQLTLGTPIRLLQPEAGHSLRVGHPFRPVEYIPTTDSGSSTPATNRPPRARCAAEVLGGHQSGGCLGLERDSPSFRRQVSSSQITTLCKEMDHASCTNPATKVRMALWVRLEAKPGQEAAVASFLEGGLPIVEQEPATIRGTPSSSGPSTFGIFDTFPDDQGREAHFGRARGRSADGEGTRIAGQRTIVESREGGGPRSEDSGLTRGRQTIRLEGHMKASVFIATSLDGFIARRDGALDWLPTGGGEPHGYEEFIASVDAIVIGRLTFETVLTFEIWPYGTKPVVTLSSTPGALAAPAGAVCEFMSGSPLEIVERLRARGFTHLYVDGGITIQRFLDAGLIQRVVSPASGALGRRHSVVWPAPSRYPAEARWDAGIPEWHGAE